MHGGRGIHEAINPTEARAHARIRAVVAGVIVVVVVVVVVGGGGGGGGGGGFFEVTVRLLEHGTEIKLMWSCC